jgi:mandelate racemase
MSLPLGTSAQTIRVAPLLLIDLETEEGVTGRTYLFCYLPLGTQLLMRVIDEIASLIKGDAVAPVEIAAKLARKFRLINSSGILSMANAGVDAACWDALAVAAGLPLANFLGGALKQIPAYNSNGLGLMSPQAASDEAEKLLEGGFRAVKLRLGYPTLDEDLAVTRAVRKRLSDAVEIMADYNQALSVEDALERGRALDGEGLSWIEEPIQNDDYAGCAKIAHELTTPIQIGENFQGPPAMQSAIAAHAADYMMPDLSRIGGVTGWQRAASLAASSRIKLSTHLFPEVSVHMLACSPTAHWLEYVDWAAPILAEPLRVIGGVATPPNRPGAGIAWNAEAVARFRTPA